MIPERLKTGIGSAEGSLSAEDITILKTRMLGLVCLLIKKAAVTAGVFVEHQERDVVDAPEIIMALKHECMQFFQRDSLESDLNAILTSITSDQETTDKLNEFIAASPDEIRSSPGHVGEGLVDTVLDVVESELQESVPERVPTIDAPCECSLCVKLLDIDFLWSAWHPTDPAEQFLKEHLETLVDVA